MSEKESRFMNILTAVLGSFILSLVIGMFVFYRMTIVGMAIQDTEIEQLKKTDQETRNIIETIRVEIRQDLKEIKMNVDKIAESQARNSMYYQSNTKN